MDGSSEDEMWDAPRCQTPRGPNCASTPQPGCATTRTGRARRAVSVPATLDVRNPGIMTSTQEALGRTLARLAEEQSVAKRVVTISPDVATSTHLSGWINKVGVFALEKRTTTKKPGRKC